MTLVKGQSSSCRKGKKVVSNASVAHDVGEEAVYSESDHSDEEVARHAFDSKCTSLINPWYDTHTHFPKVLSDYTPSSLGRVWLALCHRNIDVSWVLLASLIFNLVICQGTLLPMPILFEFGSGTALGWKEWVDRELSDMGFMGLLQRADVLKTIVSSRCLSNYRDLFNLRQWCTITHTFFLSYGEIIVTLEDMAN